MGTPYFCSLSMAKRHVFSRRDDIESVIYCLAYLIKGKLPWDQDYYLYEEEKCTNKSKDGNEWDKILERKKNINEADVCDKLPIDLKHLFKYAIRIDSHQEPDYDYVIGLLTHLRDKSLKAEGVIEPHRTTLTTMKPTQRKDSLSSKVVSRINYKSIISQVKISGMDINLNTITTLQQNKTINSVNFTNWSKIWVYFLY